MKNLITFFVPLALVSCILEPESPVPGGGGKPSEGDKTISITIPGGFSVASTRLDPNAEAAIDDLWLLTFAADAGAGTTGELEAVQQIASADLYPTGTPNEYEFRVTPEAGAHRFVLVSNADDLIHLSTITASSAANTSSDWSSYSTSLSQSPSQSPSGPQLSGTDISLTAPRIKDYAFAGWSLSGLTPISGTTVRNSTIIVDMPANNSGSAIAQYTRTNIITPAAPWITYFDSATNTLQLSSWNATSGGLGKVTQTNMMFFQFGSLVGFFNPQTGDNIQNWGDAGNQVVFNPTSTPDATFNQLDGTGWNLIPNWTDYPAGSKPSSYSAATPGATVPEDGLISSESYHNQNASAGRGDPCKLIGLTPDQIRAGALDNGEWRMPTLIEQHDNASTTPASHTWWALVSGTTNWAATGVGASTLNTTSGINGPQGFLPAAGNRDWDVGATYGAGRLGNYWVSRPSSAANGYRLSFYSGYLNSAGANYARSGFGVRCLPQ